MSKQNQSAPAPVFPRPNRLVACLALGVGVLTAPVHAQTTDASTSKSAGDQPVVLNPFEVRVSPNDGYGGSSSNIATGFNRDIAHTPLTLNVFSDAFIKDSGVDSYAELADYMPNVFVSPDPYGLGSTATARGQGTSYYVQDGRRFYTEPIISAGQRVEVVKGPATLFFGRAQPGGILSFETRVPSATPMSTLDLAYGSYGRAKSDIGSQGTIWRNKERPIVTYRVDGNFQDGGDFMDYSHDRYQQIRAAIGVQPLKTLSFLASYEYSFRDQAGGSQTLSVLSPEYYSDYANPRSPEIQWAKAAGRAGASASDAQAALWLQKRWKANINGDFNWANDVQAAEHLVDKPIRRVGIDSDLTHFGWDWNMSGMNSYARKRVYNYGAEATWTPSDHLSLKASWYGYNLNRARMDMSAATLLGDGRVYFNNPNNVVNKNLDNTATVTALSNFDIGPTSHTINLGVTRYKDFYDQYNAVYYGYNGAPGVATDIRQTAAGWDPKADGYYDISKYIKTPAEDATLTSYYQKNYENAVYGSYIAEFFNHRLGLLMGGRIQSFDQDAGAALYNIQLLPYKVSARVWTLGLSYEVRKGIILFASESTSFEPNGGQTISGRGATQNELIGNTAPSVLGRGYDLGVKFSVTDKLTGSLSYFNLVRDNDFRTEDVSKTNADPRNNDADPNNDVVWWVYGGERLSRGADLQVNWQPTKNYQGLVTVGWLPIAKITQNPLQAVPVTLGDGTVGIDPNVDNAVGLRQQFAPVLKFATWNEYTFTSGALKGVSGGLGLVYSSKVALTANRTTPQYAPGYTIFRLSAAYSFRAFGQQLRAQLIVSNLTNKRFYRGFARGEPRSFMFSLSTRF